MQASVVGIIQNTKERVMKILPNVAARARDEELLALMSALEDAGVEVITDADMPTMLS